MGEVQDKMEKPVPTVDNEMHARTGKLSGKEDVKPPSADGKYSCEAEWINVSSLWIIIAF